MTEPLSHLTATSFDGVTLPMDVRGSGEPVIFINGLTQTSAHWRTQLRLFAASGWRAVAYDGRGQGDVPAPPALTREHHAKDLCSVQDALGIEQCNIVGFSHGSRVAIAHAVRFPGRVKKLVLVGGSGGLTAARRIVIEGWRDVCRHLGPEALAIQSLPWILSEAYLERHAQEIPLMVRASVRRNRAQGTLAMLEGLLADPGTMDELERIEAPTLLLTGSEDRFATPRHLYAMAGRMRHAQVSILEGSGHSVAIEMPEQFHQSVHHFLAQ